MKMYYEKSHIENLNKSDSYFFKTNISPYSLTFSINNHFFSKLLFQNIEFYSYYKKYYYYKLKNYYFKNNKRFVMNVKYLNLKLDYWFHFMRSKFLDLRSSI